jgi:hypothetical protein
MGIHSVCGRVNVRASGRAWREPLTHPYCELPRVDDLVVVLLPKGDEATPGLTPTITSHGEAATGISMALFCSSRVLDLCTCPSSPTARASLG